MMDAAIENGITELAVRRVENGWAVSVSHYFGRDATPRMWIARTPKELADMMAEWACGQQDDVPATPEEIRTALLKHAALLRPARPKEK